MIDLTVAEAATVLGARITGTGDLGARLTDLVVDSRAVTAGSLFVAVVGERVDGHAYVDVAWTAGAAAALTSRPLDDGSPGRDRAPGLALVVDDVVLAMGTLARHLVDRAVARGLRVVGITGSQGKTSTKDLLEQVLAASAPTVAPVGNLNNEIGVPLTVARVVDATQFLISEMGARGVGHIAYLCRITPPRVGVVLNVGHAHLGEFGSQQAIAVTKGELVESLPSDGWAVLNADDPLVSAMTSRTQARPLFFSVTGDPGTAAAVWASAVTSGPDGCCDFRLHTRIPDTDIPDTDIPDTDTPDADAHTSDVSLRVAGRHQVGNALAAAGAALALGLAPAEIASALNGAGLRSRWRMETHERADGVLVVNDSYNANPDSVRAALDTLAELGRARRATHAGARTWAVVGDMLELGEASRAEHLAIGRHVASVGIDRLVAVGDHAEDVLAGAREAGLDASAGRAHASKETIADEVGAQARPGDTVLVKASRGLTLDTVAEQLLAASPPEPDAPRRAHDSEDRP